MALSKDAQRRKIVRVIRGIWSSLESHLDFSTDKKQKRCSNCGSRHFDAKCVQEYAGYIKDLADLLP